MITDNFTRKKSISKYMDSYNLQKGTSLKIGHVKYAMEECLLKRSVEKYAVASANNKIKMTAHHKKIG
jgi:hypothetical protein